MRNIPHFGTVLDSDWPPHRIEIWFAAQDGRVYLLAGAAELEIGLFQTYRLRRDPG
jgi:hypothetical protein